MKAKQVEMKTIKASPLTDAQKRVGCRIETNYCIVKDGKFLQSNGRGLYGYDQPSHFFKAIFEGLDRCQKQQAIHGGEICKIEVNCLSI